MSRHVGSGKYSIAVALHVFLALSITAAVQAAEIGAKIADFRLADTGGKTHSLSAYAGKVVVLAFWSFKCPVSLGSDDRLKELQLKYQEKGAIVLAVASNANESATEIKRNVSNLALPFPVLLDQEGAMAEKLGATHTPSAFILDRQGILRYRGALESNKKPRIPYAEQAIEEILAGTRVVTPETPAFGCSLKRKSF